MITIRVAEQRDYAAILEILKPVIRAGDTYALPHDLSDKEIIDYWFSADKETYLAEENGTVLGTYYMRPNQRGAGDHVCNCGYVTSEKARGRGIARRMCEHSIDIAPEKGFRAMQYNCVVSTNVGAVRLWERLGFHIVGTLPGAFHIHGVGDVDAYVMYQSFDTA